MNEQRKQKTQKEKPPSSQVSGGQGGKSEGKGHGPFDLVAGVDYEFDNDGLMVFTAHFLRRRGYCCKNGCRNCPYGFSKKTPI